MPENIIQETHTWKRQIGKDKPNKYNSENTNQNIQVEMLQIEKYRSENEIREIQVDKNAMREIQIGQTKSENKSEDTSRKNKNRIIYIGEYKLENNTSENTVRNNANRKIQLGKIHIGQYKPENTIRNNTNRKIHIG